MRPASILTPAWTVIAGTAGLAALTLAVSLGGGLPLDDRGLAVAAAIRHPALDRLLGALTWAGSLYLLGPIAAGLVAWLATRGRRAAATLVGLGLGGASLLAWLLKELVGRARPERFTALVDPVLVPAFPSSHTAQVTAFAVAGCLILCRRARGGCRAAVLAAGATVLLVGASRIYLQVHYPTDVLAGLLLGVTWVAAVDLMLGLRGRPAR